MPVGSNVETASHSAVQTFDAGTVESAREALNNTIGECFPVAFGFLEFLINFFGGLIVLLGVVVIVVLLELLGLLGLLAHGVGALLDDSVASVASKGDLLVAISKILHVDSSL